jgi:4-amino-4-deoxy-L-arabinose transferase-like glycosyltransferase
MTRQTALIVSLFLAALHIVFANLYASSTPYREPGILMGQRGADGLPARVADVGAPDERQHVNYVARLYQGEGFPILKIGDPQAYENYEAHQPPLYYWLAAQWMRVTGSHAPDLSLPADGGWLRAFNSLIGASTVLGVFFLGLWSFKREDVAAGAAAIAALLPMHVALSGAASNDPLLIALCTWVLALLSLSMNEGWTWKRCILIGTLTGAALLTKTTGLALLPVLLLAVFLKGAPRPSLAQILATAALAIGIALPWLLRNQQLYGDPLAMKVFKEAFQGSPQADAFIQGLGAQQYWVQMVWWWTARSFFGVFGYMDIFWPSWLYITLILTFVALFLGWLFRVRHGEEREYRSVMYIQVAFTLVIVLLFIQFNMQYFQGQGRYLFPALGPIAIVFAQGLLYYSKAMARPTIAALSLVLLGLNLYTLSKLPGEFERRTGRVAPQEVGTTLNPVRLSVRYSSANRS